MVGRNEAVGTARYETVVDASGVTKGLSEADRKIKDTGAQAEKAFGTQATGAVNKFSGGITGLLGKFSAMAKGGGVTGAVLGGVGLGAGLSAFNLVGDAIGTVTDFLGDAGQAASDLNETQSKLDQVFRTSAGTVRAWAEDSAQSMGLSKQAALEAAGTFGNFLEAMGQAEPAAADMSEKMVQLAADLGSFNNVDPTEVLDALRSGLAGETEPLRRFGVDISDAAVSAELLRQGLHKVGGQFTQSQKIAGRYALIMRQTDRAQGDYSRTATGTANAQRTLNAEMENAKAKVGEYVNNVTNALTNLAVKVIPAAIDALGLWGQAVNFALNPLGDPAARRVQELVNELKKLPEASKVSELQLYTLAQTADRLGTGFAGAADDLFDLVRPIKTVTTSSAQAAAALQVVVDRWMALGENAKFGTEAWSKQNRIMSDNADLLKANFFLLPLSLQQAMRDARIAVDTGGARIRHSFTHNFEPITGIVHGALKSAVAQAKKDMADLDWALTHPLTGQKLLNFYKRQLDTMYAKLHKAQDSGNLIAIAKAEEGVAGITAKMTALENAQFTLKVGLAYETSERGAREAQAYFNAHPNATRHRPGGGHTGATRASGGYVMTGQTYLVGENGPELLTMGDRNGYVTPNNRLGGTSSTVLIDLTPRAADALRGAGFDDRGVATWLRDAVATSGHLYATPRRS